MVSLFGEERTDRRRMAPEVIDRKRYSEKAGKFSDSFL